MIKFKQEKVIEVEIEVPMPFYFIMHRRRATELEFIYKYDGQYWTSIQQWRDIIKIEKVPRSELAQNNIEFIDIEKSLELQDELCAAYNDVIKKLS